MAQYKTIALELIRERPELYERLRNSKKLLATMDAYAIELKAGHEHWKDRLGRANPGRDPSQTASEALEIAVRELLARLPCESPTGETEPPSLDAAMSYILRHTPPA